MKQIAGCDIEYAWLCSLESLITYEIKKGLVAIHVDESRVMSRTKLSYILLNINRQ